MTIKTHIQLVDHIKDNSVLHLLSLGKDSVLCLAWLHDFAKPKRIVSAYARIDAGYPTDDLYLNYLKQRFPSVEFIETANTHELNDILEGVYQCPVITNHAINHAEMVSFSQKMVFEELRQKYQCDYLCSGVSKYEGMGRAIFLNRNGLVHDKVHTIYPIGLMTKKQVLSLLSSIQVGLNPSYLWADRTHDHPSYWKMKLAFDNVPKYKEIMFKKYPLLRLDQYRFEVLCAEKRT